MPVAVPVAVEAEGTQAHKGEAGFLAPVHTLILLAAGHEQARWLFSAWPLPMY